MSDVGWLKMSFDFGAEISTFYSSAPLLLLVLVLVFTAPCLIPSFSSVQDKGLQEWCICRWCQLIV